MQLEEVHTPQQKKAFLDVPKVLYRKDKNWVCPLDQDLEKVFDRENNTFFKGGDARRWILRDQKGELIGRIAAFYENNDSLHNGIGFFECINDQKAADYLFKASSEWLKSQGVSQMDGPISFGENNDYWGLLVDGFCPTAYGINYHFPYYKELFENYGFELLYKQYTNELQLDGGLPERFKKIAQRSLQKTGVHLEHLKTNNLGKYIQDLVAVHEEAWQDNPNYSPLSYEYLYQTFKRMEPVIDEELIWFAYVDNKPAAFMVAIPDINSVIRDFNGKMNTWNMIRFWLRLKTKPLTKVRVHVLGVVPEHQKKGLEAAMINKAAETVLPKKNYKDVILSWVGDYNPLMISLHKASGATHRHTHYTYRKAL